MEANQRPLPDPQPELPEQRIGRSWPVVLAAIALVALGGYRALSSLDSVSTIAVSQATLGLSVSHDDSGLRLVWNPASPLLHAAPRAELTIQDGNGHQWIFLSAGQIRSGTLSYTAATGEVRFSLRAQLGDRSASETVLALEAPSFANKLAAAARLSGHAPGDIVFPAGFSSVLKPGQSTAK